MPVAALLWVLLLSWPAWATAAEPPQPERAWEHARALVRDIGPRPAGSAEMAAAADYAAGHFERLGLATERVVVGHQRVPAIEVAGDLISMAREITLDDANVVATIPATAGPGGPAILIMAHLDTMPTTPGAIDNAAAVGVLLELGRTLAATDSRPHDVILAATAGEENGLLGARALAAHLGADRIAVAISMDLIGRPGPLTLNGVSANLGRHWLDRIAAAADTAKVAIEAPLTHQVVSRLAPQLERSDHGAFTEHGTPAFHLFHRGPGRIYLQYHRPQDTLEQIDVASIAAALAMLHAFVLDPAPLPEPAGPAATWMPMGNTWIVGDRALWLCELGLIAVGLLGLYRGLRSAVPWRARLVGSGAAFGITAGGWALAWVCEWLVRSIGSHPQPWIHAPGRWTVAALLLTGATFAAAAGPLRGRAHLAQGAGTAAIVIAMVPGVALWWFEVVALAWIPLVHAALLAAMVFVERPRPRAMLLGLALLPAWACVDPDLLREASFHGFLPPALALVPILLAPFFAASLAATRLLSAAPTSTRFRRVALMVAITAWILVAVGSAASRRHCAAAAFREQGLACELVALD